MADEARDGERDGAVIRAGDWAPWDQGDASGAGSIDGALTTGEGAGDAVAPDPARRAEFLQALAQTSNVRLAARAARRSVRSFYALRERDAAFDEAWQQALVQGADVAAGDLILALKGTDEEGARPADAKITLEALKIQSQLALARGNAGKAAKGAVRHVPLDEVRAEVLRRLTAVERREES